MKYRRSESLWPISWRDVDEAVSFVALVAAFAVVVWEAFR